MNQAEVVRGCSFVVQPGQSESYWQPVPANGHADPTLTPAITGFDALSMGYQTIAPGGRVREHSHGEQVELQVCFCGNGQLIVNGENNPLVPGTACLIGYDVKHEIINEGADDLVMLWIIAPAGLENFFKIIGRPRRKGEPTPEPFDRPSDIVTIERGLGMNDTRADG